MQYELEQAQTEAITTYALAQTLYRMIGLQGDKPAAEMLETANQLLDIFNQEGYTEPVNLMILQSNLWEEIKTSTTLDEYTLLLAESKSILDKDGGHEFAHKVVSIIDDKQQVLNGLHKLFDPEPQLQQLFRSAPPLENLWYDHFYVTLKLMSTGFNIVKVLSQMQQE